MAYRFLNPAPVFRSVSGEENIPGGVWEFYERGTTTPKEVYADPEGTIPNGTTVELDASARLTVEAWMVGEYDAVLKDADGATVTTKVITSGQPSGLSIPALAAGFLTNDLSNLLWEDIRPFLLPDPTGSPESYVITDGANYMLAPIPEPPVPAEPEIVITGNGTTGSYRAGTSDEPVKYLRQWGTDTAPANPGAKVTTKDVTYPVPFTEAPHPFITMNGSGFTNVGSYPDFGVTSISANGFTVKFDSQRGEGNSDFNISSAIPFFWTVEGMVNVP